MRDVVTSALEAVALLFAAGAIGVLVGELWVFLALVAGVFALVAWLEARK